MKIVINKDDDFSWFINLLNERNVNYIVSMNTGGSYQFELDQLTKFGDLLTLALELGPNHYDEATNTIYQD